MTPPLQESARVPAWTVAVSEYSLDDWVYVLDDENRDPAIPGGVRTRLIHRLTPVRVVGEDGFGHPVVSMR